MVLFLVAHSLSELTSGCNRTARFLEILFGDVRTLSAMKTRRITKQKIAFAVQAVGAVLVNDHTRILFKSHLECDASGGKPQRSGGDMTTSSGLCVAKMK